MEMVVLQQTKSYCSRNNSQIFKNRIALPAISLTSNNAVITAISNDMDYGKIFSRQIEALGKKNDVLIALTTSGRSQNVLSAVKEAQKYGMKIILNKSKCKHKITADCLIMKATMRVDRAQEMYIAIGHILCEIGWEQSKIKKYCVDAQ